MSEGEIPEYEVPAPATRFDAAEAAETERVVGREDTPPEAPTAGATYAEAMDGAAGVLGVVAGGMELLVGAPK